MLGPTAGFRQHRHDVGHCLARLIGEVVGLELLVAVPADLAGDGDHRAARLDAVGVAARPLPIFWIEEFHSFGSRPKMAERQP